MDRARYVGARIGVAAAAALAAAAVGAPPAGAIIPDATWFPPGQGPDNVASIAASGDSAWTAGRFFEIGPRTGTGASISATDGALVPQAHIGLGGVGESTNEARPDGRGGWYVAGQFELVGGLARTHLAHLLPDGSVDPAFKPVIDGPVHHLALSPDGATLYLSGGFSTVEGQARAGVAAVRAADGSPTGWEPAAGRESAPSLAVHPVGGTVYMSGLYQDFGEGVDRNLAAVDSLTGELEAVQPLVPPGLAYGRPIVSPDGSALYVSGPCDSPCEPGLPAKVRAISTSDGAIAWEVPLGTRGANLALAPEGDTLYLGWAPSSLPDTVGGVTRDGLAALRASDGSVTDWAPGVLPLAGAPTLAATAERVFVAGSLVQQPLRAVHALSRTGGQVLHTTRVYGFVHGLEAASDAAYVNGALDSVGGIAANGLARIAPEGSAAAGPGNEDVHRKVSSVAVSPDGATLYTARESFGSYAVVAYDASGATLWQTPLEDAARLVPSPEGETLYVLGGGDSVGGLPRRSLAALDTSDGSVTPWAPELNVQTLGDLAASPDGRAVYVGGWFVQGGENCHLVALDAASGSLLPWDPEANSHVTQLELSRDGDTLYAGGSFAPQVAGDVSIGGASRRHLAALSTASGDALPWAPEPNGPVRGLALTRDGTALYAGGPFTSIAGEQRVGVAGLDPSSGAATPFAPYVRYRSLDPSSIPMAVSDDGGKLFLGGVAVIGSPGEPGYQDYGDFARFSLRAAPPPQPPREPPFPTPAPSAPSSRPSAETGPPSRGDSTARPLVDRRRPVVGRMSLVVRRRRQAPARRLLLVRYRGDEAGTALLTASRSIGRGRKTRWRVVQRVRRTVTPGWNRVLLAGPWGGLRAGRYRVSVVLVDRAGNRSVRRLDRATVP